jgi:hypothetical protein
LKQYTITATKKINNILYDECTWEEEELGKHTQSWRRKRVAKGLIIIFFIRRHFLLTFPCVKPDQQAASLSNAAIGLNARTSLENKLIPFNSFNPFVCCVATLTLILAASDQSASWMSKVLYI